MLDVAIKHHRSGLEPGTLYRYGTRPYAVSPSSDLRTSLIALGSLARQALFCGTETAQVSGGYLEGALEASDRVFTALTI